jgi:predicted DNA-binding transcriptional regulator AlpA
MQEGLSNRSPCRALRSTTAISVLREFDDLPDSALIRLPILLCLLPWSRTTIWRRVKDGTLPAPLKMPGSHCVAWRVGDIRRVLASIG